MIDAHAHLWLEQHGVVDGLPVFALSGGRSRFGREIRQMLPPAMADGINSAERFLAHMDFSRVGGAVITQEYIDGNQDAYLRAVRRTWPERFRVCALYEESGVPDTEGMDGIKICGSRLKEPDLLRHAAVFAEADRRGLFISIDMADGALQTEALRELALSHPALRIAVGHFGMVTRPGWEEQIRLARLPNVFIESGGITWLFNAEYYPFPSAVRAILTARDLCGIGKLMWGSDYPRTMTAVTYRMSWDFIDKSSLLTEEEKRLFLHENAYGFYHFKKLPDLPLIRHMAE